MGFSQQKQQTQGLHPRAVSHRQALCAAVLPCKDTLTPRAAAESPPKGLTLYIYIQNSMYLYTDVFVSRLRYTHVHVYTLFYALYIVQNIYIDINLYTYRYGYI